MAQLNLLTESDMRDLLTREDVRLSEGRAAEADQPGMVANPYHQMDMAVVARAALAYRYALQRAPDQLVPLFHESAEHYVRLFECRGVTSKTDSGMAIDPAIFSADRLYVAVTSAFTLNRQDLLARLGELPMVAESTLENPGVYAKLAASLLHYAKGDVDAARPLIQQAHGFLAVNRSGLPEILSTRLLPVAKAVAAAFWGRPDAFEQPLEDLLRIHADQAQSGPTSCHPMTLICFDALALAALAKRAGIAVHTHSPYMPLQLVG